MEIIDTALQQLMLHSTAVGAAMTMNESTQTTVVAAIDPVNAMIATGVALLVGVFIYIRRHRGI